MFGNVSINSLLNINEDADISIIEKTYQDSLKKYPADLYPAENSDIVKAYLMLTNPKTIDACLDFHRMQYTSKQAYKLAEQALEEGRYDGAIKILNKTIKLEKYNDHLYHLLGIACMGIEKYAKAVKAFDQIIKKYPNDMDLLLHHTEACIAGEYYKKVIISAKRGYECEKDNILFAIYLVKGYVQTDMYGEAEAVLKEAVNNPAFHERRHGICTRLAFVLSLERKFNESLKCMEKLLTLDADDKEKIDSGEMLLNTLDYYLENDMYGDANRCMEVIIQLLPDRKDILDAKQNIERILKLEPEFCRLEKDKAVPEELVGLVINEIFPEASTGMTERQRKAYAVINEYQIMYDYTRYLMPLRYIKTKYPNIYDLKKDFFDELQDSKRRKILKTRYQALIYQYQDTFEEMMDEWDKEYDDEEYEGTEQDDASSSAENRKEPAKELSNVRPFVRREDRTGNGPCPCSSGEKSKKVPRQE